MTVPGGTVWSTNKFGARELVARLAMMLGDIGLEKYPIGYYLDALNIAQCDVCADTYALKGYGGFTTSASVRLYDLPNSHDIHDILKIHHVTVGGYECHPLPNGLADIDFVSNNETEYPENYHFEDEVMYFEYIPSGAQPVVMYYSKRPEALSYDSNNTLSLRPEYVYIILLRAKILLFPESSLESTRCQDLYQQQVERLRYAQSVRF